MKDKERVDEVLLGKLWRCNLEMANVAESHMTDKFAPKFYRASSVIRIDLNKQVF
jgi:hypothetical protein